MLMPTLSAATRGCPLLASFSGSAVAFLHMTPICLGTSKNQAVNVIALIINVIQLG